MVALVRNAFYAVVFLGLVAAAVAVVPGVEVKEKGAAACFAGGGGC